MEKTFNEQYYSYKHQLKSDWFRGSNMFMQKEYDVFKKFLIEYLSSKSKDTSKMPEFHVRYAWHGYRYWLASKQDTLKSTNVGLIQFQQDTKYGCPIYCLANLFNDGSIISENIQAYENKSLNVLDESKIFNTFLMKKSNESYHLLPMLILGSDFFSDHEATNFFSPYDTIALDDDEPTYIIFLVGVTTRTGIGHKILIVKQLGTDDYYVVDPLDLYIRKMNYFTLNIFYDMFSYSIIHRDGLGDKEFVIFGNDIVKHII